MNARAKPRLGRRDRHPLGHNGFHLLKYRMSTD